MPFAVESTRLDVVDLTDLTTVKALIDKNYVDTTFDSMISLLITAISDEFTRYLGYHTLLAERTETYWLRPGKRVLTLDARPVTAGPTSMLVASHPDDFATAAELLSKDYVVHKAGGWIQFTRRMANQGFFARATYTGGLGATAADVISDFPELSNAATLQVKHLVERRDTIGGNITTIPGAKTSFNSQYGLLSTVRHVLDSLRRSGM